MAPVQPHWLTRKIVEAIHDTQLGLHGGLTGVRDAGALESALGRPRNRWHYQEARDIADCAASYGFGIAKNHAFVDGNKRTAFVSMATFLEWNGCKLTATEESVVVLMIGVAEGTIREDALAAWLRENSKKPRRSGKSSNKTRKSVTG